MSTAVLISGQLRTFRQCLPTLQWQVFRKLKEPRFFISCADDEQARDAHQIQGLGYEVHIEKIAQPAFDDADKYLPFAQHAPYHISVPPQFILRQAWHMDRVWELAQSKGVKDSAVVIRCRPDLWMQGCDVSQLPGMWPMECFTPHWGRFGGCNDRFALMGIAAAHHYFTMFRQIDALLKDGCPFHPESLLLAALEKRGVRVHHTLNAIFSTLRLPKPDLDNPGCFIQQLRPPEILPHEIADYAKSQ